MTNTTATDKITASTITDDQIRALRAESSQVGDIRQTLICDLAIGGPEALEGSAPGTEANVLLSEERTREWARAECARVIDDARAMSAPPRWNGQ